MEGEGKRATTRRRGHLRRRQCRGRCSVPFHPLLLLSFIIGSPVTLRRRRRKWQLFAAKKEEAPLPASPLPCWVSQVGRPNFGEGGEEGRSTRYTPRLLGKGKEERKKRRKGNGANGFLSHPFCRVSSRIFPHCDRRK